MRSAALLLVLAAAPLLGGCTFVFGVAAAGRDASAAHAMRFPADPESLVLGERVRVEAPQMTTIVGRWAGISQIDTSRAYAVLVYDDANTVVPLSQRPLVYRAPPPSNATGFVLAGLALDATIVVVVIRGLRGIRW